MQREDDNLANAASEKQRNRAGVLQYALRTVLALSVLVLGILRWGGYLLISDDPVPVNVDAAVVLQGSVLGEKARVAGVVHLLQQGKVPLILLSVPKESYWGRPVAPIAYAYIETNYGHEAASRVDFCETGDVDSTDEEAKTLAECIRGHAWKSIVVVTSNYHTRRAGLIWRKLFRQEHSFVRLSIHGVDDPEFLAAGWWHDRRSAKTWVMESMKLVWMLAGE